MKYNIGDYLIASPFSAETDFEGTLTEDIFYNDFFIKLEEYDRYSESLDRLFNHTTHQLPLTIYFYGYSGTGKTTFIQWFAKNLLQKHETIFFDFTNVIGSKHYGKAVNADNGLKIFDDKLQDILSGLYPENKETLKTLLKTVSYLSPFIQTTFSTEFFEQLYNLDLDAESGYRNQYFKFIRNIYYLDLLLLLFLFYYYQPRIFLEKFTKKECVDINLPLVIIFDNIDHVEIESENSMFPSRIESVYHNFKMILREFQKHMKKEYEKLHKNNRTIKFLFCMRDANVSLLNRQVSENTVSEDIYFCPSNSDKDILLKRVSIAERDGVEIDTNRKKLLKFILNDDYTQKVFTPLFNLNIRKLANLISNTIVPHNGTYLQLLIDLNQNNNTVVGARGIEYYLIIKQLQKTDYLKDTIFVDDGGKIGGTRGGYVNPARIILTNLLNLTHFSMDEKVNEPHYTPAGLFELYELYNEIFKNRHKRFFKVLTKLFHSHKSNWCHLISFTNKKVYGINDFTEELKLIEEYEKLPEGNEARKHDIETELNKIKVSLNPSGYMYIKDIIKHYEYFSLKANNPEPLFASLGYKKKANNSYHFDFVDNINKTKIVTKECVESLKKFLESGIIDEFELSKHVFRTYRIEEGENEDFHENRVGRLLIVRIIHTHIRYIDEFRVSILKNKAYWEKISKNEIEIFKMKDEVNQEIMKHLQDYIDMLKGTKGTVQYLIRMFEKNMEIIQKHRKIYHQLNDS